MASPSGSTYLNSFTLGAWAPLGRDLTVHLAGRRTVLVGRNGAGKSMILEGLETCADLATFSLGGRLSREGPRRFSCNISTSVGSFEYSFKRRTRIGTIQEGRAVRGTVWEEKCIDAAGKEVWTLEKGLASGPGFEQLHLSPGTSLLNTMIESAPTPVAAKIRSLLSKVFRITGGVPRDATRRRSQLFTVYESNFLRPVGAHGERRISAIAQSLWSAMEHQPELFDEFVEIGRSLGVFRRVSIESLRPEDENKNNSQFLEISFDGVNIGLISDGTLRVAEIVLGLVVDPPGSLLLVEEPETAIHPGLLSRVLAVCDSYSIDRQMLISTHSPRVVSWAKPDELRLVRRQEGRTSTRELVKKEISQLGKYLDDDGSLGDFVYEGELL